MTHKERVLAVLNHRLPDRVPINFSGANSDIDSRLKKYFCLDNDDHVGLLDALDVDFRIIDISYTGKQLHRSIKGKHVDPLWGIHTRWVENESGGYWDFCDFPLSQASFEDVENWPMPSPDDFDYDEIKNQCEKYKDYCVVYGGPGIGDIINSTGMIRTMEQVLIDFITDDPVGLRYIERKISIQAEILKRVLDAADGQIDLVWIGEDLGTQNSQLVSLDIFRKHIRPNHQRLVKVAKEHNNLPVMIHSCGSSSWAFNDFIDMGIDVVDTLQPEAKNMSPEYLKEKYDGRLCFNGCISTAGPMAYGTRQETVEYVKKIMDVMMPGGGYIMAPTHMLQDNSPTENVIAAYQTAIDYGKY